MKLDKHNFIKRLLSRFPYYTQNDNGSFYDSYSRVLTRKIDYEKLWDLFCNSYDKNSPPTGVYLKELAKLCYLEDFKSNTSNWLHVKVLNPKTKRVRNLDCFPKNTTNEQILKTYEKKFSCEGWKIIEVKN